ncbi:MAG: glycine--tRNA ligase subunit beta, partial [Geminicoccaceae bacterium]
MAELLLELLSEEIPARMQARAAANLGELVAAALDQAELAYGTLASYRTPRRLTLVVRDLVASQPDVET